MSEISLDCTLSVPICREPTPFQRQPGRQPMPSMSFPDAPRQVLVAARPRPGRIHRRGRRTTMPGVHAVLTRDELVGLSPVYGYFIKDQPIVAMDKVRYIGDVVAAVAADTEKHAVAALEQLVTYELFRRRHCEEAMADEAPELFEEEPMGIVPAYGQGASGYRRIGRNNCYRFSYETGMQRHSTVAIKSSKTGSSSRGSTFPS